MCRDVTLEFLARQVGRIEIATRRPRRGSDKGCILTDQIEAAAVDAQETAQVACLRTAIAPQLPIQLQPRRITLLPVDAVEIAAGFNQLADHAALARVQRGEIEGHRYALGFGKL